METVSHEPFQNVQIPTRKRRRPPYSYTALIAQAILVSEHKQLTLREIYDSINRMYPQICQGPDIGWQNTIRHNLSLNSCFKRIPRQQLPDSLSSKLRGKGSYWTVDVNLMDANTRQRLEEAVSNMSQNTNDNNAASEKPCKRAKTVYVPKSAPHSNAANIRCVSPTIQSPLPYFQSALNSPITSVSKPASKQYSRHFPCIPNSALDLPTNTPYPSADHRGRLHERPSSCHIDQRFPFDAQAAVWPNDVSASSHYYERPPGPVPVPVSPYFLGTTISYARSTARASTREPRIVLPASSSINPSSAASSTLGSRQNSPYSLSPALSTTTNHDIATATASNSSSSKLNINSILN
ncbi:hypothetical protein EV183_004364 [Coemansia sp. RSA 2336]|nr:hypothetical protein EV183_004364 [Coemansia sp. RSA 2336]